MSILVFSDIHGSFTAAQKIVALVNQYKPEAVLLLGDILYHGPRNPLPSEYDPLKVVEALTPLKSRIAAVAGNCDCAVDEMVLPFPLASDFFWYISNGLRLYATHGHKAGPNAMPPLEEGDVLLTGHTHVPTAQVTASGIHLCNPGSISLPKEGHPPSYGVFVNNEFSVFSTHGELYLHHTCV